MNNQQRNRDKQMSIENPKEISKGPYQPASHLVEKGLTALYMQWFLMKARVNLQIAKHNTFNCQKKKNDR